MKNGTYEDALQLTLLAEYKKHLQSIEEKLRNIEDSSAIIQGLLEALLAFYDADRAYIIEVDWELMCGATTYEVCAEGITSNAEEMQYLQTEVYHKWAQLLMQNQPVIIPDVAELKASNPAEYDVLHAQNITSELAVPFSKKYTHGFVGVDNPRVFAEDPSFDMDR